MKKPISATIDVELIKWLESELKGKLKYRNKSHLIEIALYALKNKKFRQIEEIFQASNLKTKFEQSKKEVKDGIICPEKESMWI